MSHTGNRMMIPLDALRNVTAVINSRMLHIYFALSCSGVNGRSSGSPENVPGSRVGMYAAVAFQIVGWFEVVLLCCLKLSNPSHILTKIFDVFSRNRLNVSTQRVINISASQSLWMWSGAASKENSADKKPVKLKRRCVEIWRISPKRLWIIS